MRTRQLVGLVLLAGVLAGILALRRAAPPSTGSPPPPPGPPAAAPTPPPPAGAHAPPGPQPAGRARLRVVAANLTSGRGQSWDPGHGLRILQALRPDVALVQELKVGGNSAEELRRFAEQACGPGASIHREPDRELPNGVISRWPIRAAGAWEDAECPNREFAWARIDIPGPTDLWAVSVHLLTRSPAAREAEGRQLVGYLREHVPTADYLLVGGDLNTKQPDEPLLAVLGAVVASARVPVDERGLRGTNATRRRPYDWLLLDPDLQALEVPVELGGRAFTTGLVFDTRTFSALDAVPPARRDDSAAEEMQHMAVVRDFLLPTAER